MASCLLSSPRIHSPPDSLMRRTSVTKVSGNRVFQQAARAIQVSQQLADPAAYTFSALPLHENLRSASLTCSRVLRYLARDCCHRLQVSRTEDPAMLIVVFG